MNAAPPVVQFLIKTTGLPREQILTLYRAGHPWPLWATYEVRKAGILAQAEGLLFSAALEKAESVTEDQAEDSRDTLNPSGRTKHNGQSSELDAARTALPFLQEIEAHVMRVSAATGASCRSIFRLSVALQSYAEEHPGWELMHMCVGRRPS